MINARALVRVPALAADRVGQAAVMVPAHVKELDAADIAFGQAPREQAVGRVAAGAFDVGSVRIERGLRLFARVEKFGHARLHAKRHFVLRDARLDFGIVERRVVFLVEAREPVERFAPQCRIDAGGFCR